MGIVHRGSGRVKCVDILNEWPFFLMKYKFSLLLFGIEWLWSMVCCRQYNFYFMRRYPMSILSIQHNYIITINNLWNWSSTYDWPINKIITYITCYKIFIIGVTGTLHTVYGICTYIVVRMCPASKAFYSSPRNITNANPYQRVYNWLD